MSLFISDISLAYAPVIEDIRPFLGILVGLVGSIVLVALIIVIIVRMRGSSGRDRNNYSAHQVSRDTLQHNGQSIQDMRIGRDICQTSSVDSIDKNPDIIPQGNSCLNFPLLPWSICLSICLLCWLNSSSFFKRTSYTNMDYLGCFNGCNEVLPYFVPQRITNCIMKGYMWWCRVLCTKEKVFYYGN